MRESDLNPVDDMIKLEGLSEASILHNVRSRFRQDQIYTWIGSILISVNPYKQVPIYNENSMKFYHGKELLLGVEPHIYALAEHVFTSLLREGLSQSVIVAGESGAGFLFLFFQ